MSKNQQPGEVFPSPEFLPVPLIPVQPDFFVAEKIVFRGPFLAAHCALLEYSRPHALIGRSFALS